MKLFMRNHTSNQPAYVYIIFPCQMHFTCSNAHDAIAYGTELLSNITGLPGKYQLIGQFLQGLKYHYWSLAGDGWGRGGGHFLK